MRTDLGIRSWLRKTRPGILLGRTLTGLVLLASVAGPAHASSSGDLFSWWHRQLLPLSFEPGSWVTVAREDVAEGQILTDTLTCRVLEARSETTRWIQVDIESTQERWLVHVDPAAMGRDRGPLDMVLDLVQLLPSGDVVVEDVAELRESEFAQKTLQDVFTDPDVQISALPDSLHEDRVLTRRAVRLTESLETRLPMGDREMIHSTELVSTAVLSEQVPILGVLSAYTRTETATRWEGNVRGQQRPRPPLITETRTVCLDFGKETPRSLPAALGR